MLHESSTHSLTYSLTHESLVDHHLEQLGVVGAEAEASAERAPRELAHVIRHVDAHLVHQRRRAHRKADALCEVVQFFRIDALLQQSSLFITSPINISPCQVYISLCGDVQCVTLLSAYYHALLKFCNKKSTIHENITNESGTFDTVVKFPGFQTHQKHFQDFRHVGSQGSRGVEAWSVFHYNDLFALTQTHVDGPSYKHTMSRELNHP